MCFLDPPSPYLHHQNSSRSWGREGKNQHFVLEFLGSPDGSKHLKSRRKERTAGGVGLWCRAWAAKALLYHAVRQRLGQNGGGLGVPVARRTSSVDVDPG